MGRNVRTALLSVYDKTDIVSFAKGLEDLGWDLYASGGTAKKIAEAGIKVRDVAELVGGKAILGHRVVTLSREIHAGLLADDSPEQIAELKRLGIPRIDLVCVDMYPLSDALTDSKATEQKVLELTDVGGPTLLHAAAKGRRIVLSRPEQRSAVLSWLQTGEPDKQVFLKELAAIAELEAAQYLLSSAEYLANGEVVSFVGTRSSELRYGENPWQRSQGLFMQTGQLNDSLSLAAFEQKAGHPMSVTNYTDVDRLLQTMTHIAAGYDRNYQHVPAIALGAKHGNVCGTAIHEDPAEAIKSMLNGDPRAIFGGSIMCNFKITKTHAELLKTHGMVAGRRLIDIIIAPSVTEDAMKYLLPKKSRLRILINPALAKLYEKSLDTAQRCRYVRGGALVQDNYTFVFDFTSPDLQKNGQLSETQKRDVVLAWAIGSTSNSNTITIVKNGMLLGNGVGQQDRVSAAQLAVNRAREAGHKEELKGSVAYSDSFFPFPDAPESLAKAGVTAIFTTSGSVKDEEVVDAMKKLKVAFYTLPDTVAPGFYAH
jgi:phosphoribosylaminoimidazolecarboxamide formyltransferase / IMP cyclohydrolase